MEIIETNMCSTVYGVEDLDPESSDFMAKLSKSFFDLVSHHGLVLLEIKKLTEIEKISSLWKRSHLKKAMKLCCGYKRDNDSLFLPYVGDGQFGFMELISVDQLRSYKFHLGDAVVFKKIPKKIRISRS